MEDIKEFKKMYKVKIPCEEYSMYYIQTLLKSKEYSNLTVELEKFEQLEEYISNSTTYQSVGQYKRILLDTVVNKLKNSLTYKNILEYDYSKYKFKTINNRNDFYDRILFSLDLKNANYQIFKLFDKDNTLLNDYKEFCDSFDMHEALTISKSFRQVIFGNLNPKRTQKIQLYYTSILSNLLEKYKFKLVFLSNDEVIVCMRDNIEDDQYVITKLLEDFKKEYSLEYRITPQVLKKLDKKDRFIKKILNNKGELEYNSLQGIPLNEYFKYFKEYILEEPINNKDITFVIEGKKAKWIIN